MPTRLRDLNDTVFGTFLANLPGLQAGEPGFTTDSYDLYVGIDSSLGSNKIVGSHRFWTNNTSSIGIIAQEIEKVLPELVSQSENHKTVNYNGLIGVLIEAIKEQQKQIDELRNNNLNN